MDRTSNAWRSSRHARTALLAVVSIGTAACGSSTPSLDTGADASSGSAAAGASGSGTGGSTGSGGSGSGGSGIEIDAARSDAGSGSDATGCGQSSVQASTKIVNILLVIDRSGSMTAKPTGFAVDKWTATKNALSGALDGVKGGISFGLELFPNNLVTAIPTACTSQCWDMPPGDSAVAVPVGPATTTVATILGKLDQMPSGGTPTAAALAAAAGYFSTGGGKDLPGEKYVLLATDGGPNGNAGLTCDQTTCTVNMDRGETASSATNYCSAAIVSDGPKSCLDESATLAQLTSLNTKGIKTFVIGIPGTDPYVSTLDAMAVAGGAPASATSPKYFAVSATQGAEGLQQVLETITRQLIMSCRLKLQSNPPDLGLLNVYVDGTVVPKPGIDGWDLDTSTAPPTIVLKGATCAAIEATGASRIDVQYGCPTVTVN